MWYWWSWWWQWGWLWQQQEPGHRRGKAGCPSDDNHDYDDDNDDYDDNDDDDDYNESVAADDNDYVDHHDDDCKGVTADDNDYVDHHDDDCKGVTDSKLIWGCPKEGSGLALQTPLWSKVQDVDDDHCCCSWLADHEGFFSVLAVIGIHHLTKEVFGLATQIPPFHLLTMILLILTIISDL